MQNRHCNNCGHTFEIYHVLPNMDKQLHSENYKCHCEPEIMNEGLNMVVVHNAFDGREGVEWANEILK